MCVFRVQDLHLAPTVTSVCCDIVKRRNLCAFSVSRIYMYMYILCVVICYLVEVWKLMCIPVSRIDMYEYFCVL